MMWHAIDTGERQKLVDANSRGSTRLLHPAVGLDKW